MEKARRKQRNIMLLYIDGWFELEELPSMETCVSLKELQGGECVKLKRNGLVDCTKLLLLYVDGCSEYLRLDKCCSRTLL